MKKDLNLLTEDEIYELEDFVKSKIKKEDKSIKKFFDDLKSGKLKNKHIESDALDFIYEGLTDVVDSWIEEKGNIGEVEKVVCAQNTRVGKFLSTYNKKQINLRDGIEMLKKDNVYSEAIRAISNTYLRRDYFSLGDHDVTHTQRVILNAAMIMNLRNELSERERKMIFTAIMYHDTGRIHDFEDKCHGERAVQNFTDELDEFSEDEQDLIKFMITQHCKSKLDNEAAINNLSKSEEEKEKYRLFLNYIKDADKLDRVRFPEVIPMLSDSLDPDRLHFDESKRIIRFACESLENTDLLLSIKNNKSKEDLFRRDKIFAEIESGDQLAQSVYDVLRKNGYPERSKNLKLNKVHPHNSKFIKDGYLYLLRGSRKGQMSGFFTYPYSKEKKNVEQYLRENPSEIADILASRQSMKGRERFISTTTDITVAAEFSRLDLDKNISGSIYVLKIKPEDVFRIMSPVALDKFYGLEGFRDESEYLIPDFVRPEEIIKEFRYNDYIGIYEYLKNEIGLDIKKSDIVLKENIEDQPELSDRHLNQLRKLNDLNNKIWKGNTNNDNISRMAKILENGNGKTGIEKLLNGLFDPHDDDPR